jgi:DNA polymerase III epsilon subunit-like protein
MMAFKHAYPHHPYSLADCARKFDRRRRFGLAHCAIDDAELLAAVYSRLIEATDLRELND